jgi:hypothetical protein
MGPTYPLTGTSVGMLYVRVSSTLDAVRSDLLCSGLTDELKRRELRNSQRSSFTWYSDGLVSIDGSYIVYSRTIAQRKNRRVMLLMRNNSKQWSVSHDEGDMAT